ncbi:MAG TPA: cytosine permease, partial [Thermoleophilia bacterium]|nr:cytosine permease [Thermoleophilia bacterium]
MSDTSGSAVAKAEKVLVDEHEWEAVPQKDRRPRWSVTLVWLGFPMVISGTALGATLALGMGFTNAVLGIVLGNLFLLFYVGFLSRLAQKSGYNFPLLCRTTFGSKGFSIASGLLATIVIGWFTVQTALVAVNVDVAFGWNLKLWAVIAGLLYMGVAIAGIRALTWIGSVSAPLFVIFGLYAFIDAMTQASWSSMTSFGGDPDASKIALGAAVTLVAAFFIDSGTMTPDFTRWAKTPTDAWIATAAAFPIGCGFAMLIGAFIASASPDRPEMFTWLADKGGIIAVLATIFMFINLGSVCSHCLYNAAVGWAHLTHIHYRWIALVFGIIGTIIATTNAWAHFIDWLVFLGIIIPPVGAVILADHMLPWSRHTGHDPFDLKGIAVLRPAPFISWGIGSVV